MPTKTKAGVICLLEFKRMSDVTNHNIVRGKQPNTRDGKRSYASTNKCVVRKCKHKTKFKAQDLCIKHRPTCVNKWKQRGYVYKNRQAWATRRRADIQANNEELQTKKTTDTHERKRHTERRERTCPIDQTRRAGDRRGVDHLIFRPMRGPQGLNRQGDSVKVFQKNGEDFEKFERGTTSLRRMRQRTP